VPGSSTDAALARPPIYRRQQYLGLLGVGLISFGLLSIVQSKFAYGLMQQWAIFSILGLGFYLVFGLGGQFAFSQGAFFGLGAYSSAWATRNLSFLWGVGAAIIIGCLVALVFAIIVFRADHFYFAIGTMAFSFIAIVVFREFTAFSRASGEVVGIPKPQIANHAFNTDYKLSALLIVFMLLALLLVILVERSPLRREALALNHDSQVASTLGIPTGKLRLLMFVLGSGFAAVAGALQAHRTGSLSTEQFSVQLSIDIFLILLLGGIGSIYGPLLGAAFVVWAPEQMRFIANYRGIIYGAVLIIVMILFPKGLVGIFEALWRLIRGKRKTPEDGLDPLAFDEAAIDGGANAARP